MGGRSEAPMVLTTGARHFKGPSVHVNNYIKITPINIRKMFGALIYFCTRASIHILCIYALIISKYMYQKILKYAFILNHSHLKSTYNTKIF